MKRIPTNILFSYLNGNSLSGMDALFQTRISSRETRQQSRISYLWTVVFMSVRTPGPGTDRLLEQRETNHEENPSAGRRGLLLES